MEGGTLLDCSRCQSAGSIDHGMCQVCLYDLPRHTVVDLAAAERRAARRRLSVATVVATHIPPRPARTLARPAAAAAAD